MFAYAPESRRRREFCIADARQEIRDGGRVRVMTGTDATRKRTKRANSRERVAAWLAVGMAVVAAVGVAVTVRGASVVGSKHDIADPASPDRGRVCMYCHTPHHANNSFGYPNPPLWNRYIDTSKVYQVYSSTTMDTTPGDPQRTISILCLGCHDGVVGSAVVNGITGSDKHDLVVGALGERPDMSSIQPCQNCHPDYFGGPAPYRLGTDLSNDHPIAMTYPTQAQDPRFNLPPDLSRGWPDLPLYNGKVECATCHNVHDPGQVPFLRISNAGSGLCVRCHLK